MYEQKQRVSKRYFDDKYNNNNKNNKGNCVALTAHYATTISIYKACKQLQQNVVMSRRKLSTFFLRSCCILCCFEET
jgi:hypothetical protein